MHLFCNLLSVALDERLGSPCYEDRQEEQQDLTHHAHDAQCFHIGFLIITMAKQTLVRVVECFHACSILNVSVAILPTRMRIVNLSGTKGHARVAGWEIAAVPNVNSRQLPTRERIRYIDTMVWPVLISSLCSPLPVRSTTHLHGQRYTYMGAGRIGSRDHAEKVNRRGSEFIHRSTSDRTRLG